MTKISKDLYEFLKSYAKWAYEGGAPAGEPFSRAYGLCAAASIYDRKIFYVDQMGVSYALSRRLRDEFGSAASHPFGKNAYIAASQIGSQHLDSNRRAWVLKTIAEYEEQQKGK